MINKKRLREKQMSMFDDMLDQMCEMNGVIETITELIYLRGFTKEELLVMYFAEDDINKAIEIHNEHRDYDNEED